MQHQARMKPAFLLLALAGLATAFLAGALWTREDPSGVLALVAAASALGCLGFGWAALVRAERVHRRALADRADEVMALAAALRTELESYRRALDRRAGHIRALVEARARAGDPEPSFEITPAMAEILSLPPATVFEANAGRLHMLPPEAAADLTRFWRLIEDARGSLDVRRRNWRKRAEVFEDLGRVAESAAESLTAEAAPSIP